MNHQKICIGTTSFLSNLLSPQDCIPFHYFFYGEDKGLWRFFLKNWKTFFMTLIFFKISFMENLAFVLVHVLRRTEAHRRLENVYFFSFKSFFFRQLIVIFENMTTFRTLIRGFWYTKYSTNTGLEINLAMHTLQSNESPFSHLLWPLMTVLYLENFLSETNLYVDLDSGGFIQREAKGSCSSIAHKPKIK